MTITIMISINTSAVFHPAFSYLLDPVCHLSFVFSLSTPQSLISLHQLPIPIVPSKLTLSLTLTNDVSSYHFRGEGTASLMESQLMILERKIDDLLASVDLPGEQDDIPKEEPEAEPEATK